MIDLSTYNGPWRLGPGNTMITDDGGGFVCAVAMIDAKLRRTPMVQKAKLVAASPQLLQAAGVALDYLSSTLNGDPDDPALTAWNALADAISSATT